MAQRAVDSEGSAEWGPPVPWYVDRYGLERVETSQSRVGLQTAQAAADRAAVRGAVTFVLAQLPDEDKRRIAENVDAFERWSTRDLYTAPPSLWIRSRKILEERIDRRARAARVLMRSCVNVARLRSAIDRRIALLDARTGRAIIIVTNDARIGRALAQVVTPFHLAPATLVGAKEVPRPESRGGRTQLRGLLKEHGVQRALLAVVAVEQKMLETSRGPVEVTLTLTAVDGGGQVIATEAVTVMPKTDEKRRASESVADGWKARLQPGLEEILVALKK